MLRNHLFAAPLLLAALAAFPLRAVELDRLKELTVQIQVQRENKPPEFGSGVLLCTDDDGRAYIVTAYHVLFERHPGEITGSRRNVVKTSILFYQGLAERVDETEDDLDRKKPKFEPHQVPEKDLLLLITEMRRPLLPPAERGRATAGSEKVHAIGYAKDTPGEKEWVQRTGIVRQPGTDFISHSARLEEGFSGGPLFDDAGGLIGINVEFTSDSEAGDDRIRIGKAVPIDQVREAFKKLVPQSCWGNQEELARKLRAEAHYKRALQQISIKNWKKAEEILCLAYQENPREGGSVHLQGMRYTTYLPAYHLGVALFMQGRWKAAYWKLRESEVQREILKDKRSRTMKRYLRKIKEEPKTNDTFGTSACPQNDEEKS